MLLSEAKNICKKECVLHKGYCSHFFLVESRNPPDTVHTNIPYEQLPVTKKAATVSNKKKEMIL